MKFYQYLEQESTDANKFISIVNDRLFSVKQIDPTTNYTVAIPKAINLTDADKNKVINHFKKDWPNGRFYTTKFGQSYFILSQ